MADHDQRFKTLVREFIAEFFQLFFPKWAARFAFSGIEWLDKEIFTDPPDGSRRILDLVARLPVHQALKTSDRDEQVWLALLHVEIESRDSIAPVGRRMSEIYMQLRRLYELPVLPIGLFLRVGLDGVGWDVYQEHFWDELVSYFRYTYVGLPALDAEEYLHGENLLGVALTALMKVSPERRLELHAEALQRIAESKESDHRRDPLADCVQAYMPLDKTQRQAFNLLLTTNKQYGGAQAIMITAFEEGVEQGIEQGIEKGIEKGMRATLTRQVDARFGPLSAEVLDRLALLSSAQLSEMLLSVLTAESLKELGLQD